MLLFFVLFVFCIYCVQSWDYEYSMHTLNILSLNVNGLNSAVKRTRVLEYLHRKSSGVVVPGEVGILFF